MEKMNKLRLFILMALLTLVGNAFADDVTVSDVSIAAGETKSISIELNNPSKDYIAFEFWMRLPDGVRVEYDEWGDLVAVMNDSRSNGHVLEVSEPNNDGVYHFLGYSARNKSLKERSGELINLTIHCAEDAEAGSYTASVYDLIFSDSNKAEVDFADFTFSVNIKDDILVGDVNVDGGVDISDVVALVNMILGSTEKNAPADVNNDGQVDISDVVALVNIILGAK